MRDYYDTNHFFTVGGSCANAGYQACCSFTYSNDFCRGDDGVCMCDDTCSFFGDCCSDHSLLCPGVSSSCAAANYTSCCTSGDCFGATQTCKCDAACRTRGDCCDDIETTCCKLLGCGREWEGERPEWGGRKELVANCPDVGWILTT
jgi:hypothetical protein